MSKSKNSRPRKGKKETGNSLDVTLEVLPPEIFSAEPVTAEVVAAVSEAARAVAEAPTQVSPGVDIDLVVLIGFAAGKLWQALLKGPLSLSELSERVGEPETVLLMAAGWLAREDKLGINQRGQRIELRLKEAVAHRA